MYSFLGLKIFYISSSLYLGLSEILDKNSYWIQPVQKKSFLMTGIFQKLLISIPGREPHWESAEKDLGLINDNLSLENINNKTQLRVLLAFLISYNINFH